jgi:uncharacterized protein YndB with AHSA1/START domain
MDDADRTIVSTRVLAFAPAQVFRAIAEPERIARWWGPAGFTNTIASFDFREGGEWVFTMHGPDGKDYPNHSRFETIAAPRTVVMRHLNAPHFTMHMSLAAEGRGTRLQWRQVFDDARTREQLAPICVPSNEQNFDRLADELRQHP